MEDLLPLCFSQGTKRSRSGAFRGLHKVSARGMAAASGEEVDSMVLPRQELTIDGERAVEDVLGMPDMLKNIFVGLSMKDLCCVSGVCRLWRDVSQADEFWSVVNFEGHIRRPSQVLQVLRRHPNVKELSLRGVPLDVFMARLIFRNLKCTTILHMGKSKLTEESLNEAAGNMPNLDSWIVTDAYLGTSNTASVIVSHEKVHNLVMENCKMGRLVITCNQLRSLSLQESTLPSLTLSCPQLTYLGLQGCQKMTDFALRNVLSRVPTLSKLDVSDNVHLSDDTLREVGQHCGSLTSLVACGCVGLTMNAVRALPALRSLNLARCESLVPTGMAQALDGCTNLEYLCLDSCSTLTQLALSMPRLRTISLQGCKVLTQVVLRCPWLDKVYLGANVTSTGSLKRIDLASTAVASIAWRGISTLETVALDCPHLISLDLSCCEALMDSIFASLGDDSTITPGYHVGQIKSKCPSLRYLKLDNCSSLLNADLRSASLQQLSLAGCKNLKQLVLDAPQLLELHLDECDHLTTICMTPIAVKHLSLGTCPRLLSLYLRAQSLVRLDLMGCGMLTTLQLECPLVQRLDCTYCMSLPDTAIVGLAAGAPRLTTLILSVCPSVSRPGLRSLHSLAHLRSLDLSYTDVEVLDAVFEACPRLETLKLLSCSSLQAEALQCLLPSTRGGVMSTGAQALLSLAELDVSYCNRLPTKNLADLLLRGRQLKVVDVNGCEGMTESICTQLSSPSLDTSSQVHVLQELNAKSCKNLRAFWLGAPPLTQPEARLPPSCSDGFQQHQLPLALAQPATTWLPTPLAGLRVLRLGLSAIRSLALALPELTLLDVCNCQDLWRVQIQCPKLIEAYFQSCRSLSSAAVAVQLKHCNMLERVGLPQAEVEEALLAMINGGNAALQIVPPPA